MKDKPENFRFQEPFLNGVQKNGHYLPIFSHPKHFLIFARRVLGWSIIPLWGAARSPQAKLPALPRWRAYQQHPPSDDELQTWFDTPSMQAFGIVTGQVSRLLVVDLDCPQQAADFQAAFPQLLDTLTISSGQRGLPHYYFRLPEGVMVKGLHGSGVDLRAEGQYVVAPLTSVGEHTWSITHARMPRLITEADAAALTAFVRRQTKPASSATPLAARMSPIGDNSLADRYFALAPKMGRNNALFNTACFGRDQGWPERDVCRQLVTIHALHPPVSEHLPETPQQRHDEAIATIASAYSQPARSVIEHQRHQQLPNSVREALLQKGLDNAARLLDALLMRGYRAGQVFTASEVYEAVGAWGIGRNMVYAVLGLCLSDADLAACPAATAHPAAHPSPPDPLNPADAAMRCADKTKKMLFGRVTKPGKTPGRPEHQFVMPSIKAVCALLKVRPGTSDPLQPADLASNSVYRQALHAALIRRRPGQYSRSWQGARLGISAESCRRYERRMGIVVQPVYLVYPLNWTVLESIVPDEPLAGTFLEDAAGKRYPPLLPVARKLLARRQAVFFKRQVTNHYGCASNAKLSPIGDILPASQGAAQSATPPAASRTLNPVAAAVAACAAVCASAQEAIHILIQRDGSGRSVPAPISSSHLPQVPPIDAAKPVQKPDLHERRRQCAAGLYEMLRRRNPQKSLTQTQALALVKEFGVALVERAMRVIARRADLYNPAGFLRVWLRGERLRAALEGKMPPPASSVKARPTPRLSEAAEAAAQAAWIEKLRNSPYAAFYANAADFSR